MAAKYLFTWPTAGAISVRAFTCGFCGKDVAPDKGWQTRAPGGSAGPSSIFICHNCQGPTFIDDTGQQFPGVPFGNDVSDITDQGVASLYQEARRATAASCYTAAVLCCRKILMHVAVAKGAQPGDKFIKYVEHLAAQGYIPPDARAWVDHIRDKSNEANHEIVTMSRAEAEDLLSFTGMLLKLVFEYPEAMKKKVAARQAEAPAKK